MSYEMACVFVTETENAVLIRDPATDKQHWLPLSQVEKMTKTKQPDGTKAGAIVMTDWIATQKGLL